jgi:hypothetical protein
MANLQLDAIKFNHDPSSANRDALSIRRNAAQLITVPEWQRGVSVNPEDSLAAYALRRVRGNTVTIQASFTSSTELASVEIRAVDNVVDPPQEPGCLGIILQFLRWLIRALVGNVLGEAQARTVNFSGTTSGFVDFTLVNHRLPTARVGTHTTEWRWQYRPSPNHSWQDITVSKHRIYLVIDLPTLPWTQSSDPTDAGLPWTEVLDHACAWASWTADPDEAAGAVTRSVYGLGPTLITYDCPGGGSSQYSGGVFACTQFLDRLRGGLGNGIYVNCSDCATISSTFANILGCDLWQSRMGSGFFHLNDILAIGSSVWQPACHGSPGWHDGFSYHEVAWKAGCTADDAIFDACLQVDGDPDPTTAPHTALQPIDLRFGNPGDGQYRDRLAVPADRGACSPLPGTRQRRAVS